MPRLCLQSRRLLHMMSNDSEGRKRKSEHGSESEIKRGEKKKGEGDSERKIEGEATGEERGHREDRESCESSNRSI